ncbi:MAG: N-acetyltransferase [Proteobacteria bacterium]|nr:N-acetyltransferase [Pseudomonadota bacterium]
MEVQCISSLESIKPTDWDALLFENHPLLCHAFLYAMEEYGCLTEQSGWIPRYLIVKEGNELIAAMPLYEKTNSWGEFVFDHAWADAYARYGEPYYPKLVAAIPFTPVFGQKLLLKPGRQKDLYPVLLEGALQLAKQLGSSSLHILFPLEQEQVFFEQQGLTARHDCQYHWHNNGYVSFEAFLFTLKRNKRRKINQERRKVKDAGIRFRRLDGSSATPTDWENFTEFYNLTYERKWGAPVFSQAFFQAMAKALGERMILILANQGENCVAGALMYLSDSVLYGRHWGCSEYYDALHFETCYYQGIEICIEKGIKIFEPGAQGPHKLARGFEPTRTHSSHWLADQHFVPAIARFCADETIAVDQHIAEAKAHSAYKAG